MLVKCKHIGEASVRALQKIAIAASRLIADHVHLARSQKLTKASGLMTHRTVLCCGRFGHKPKWMILQQYKKVRPNVQMQSFVQTVAFYDWATREGNQTFRHCLRSCNSRDVAVLDMMKVGNLPQRITRRITPFQSQLEWLVPAQCRSRQQAHSNNRIQRCELLYRVCKRSARGPLRASLCEGEGL